MGIPFIINREKPKLDCPSAFTLVITIEKECRLFNLFCTQTKCGSGIKISMIAKYFKAKTSF
ncbi:hypothetical protein F5ESL0259_03500 [Lactobacillus sp. ESL0259]|nr:hypothetical protein F5ESL0259_03500 [Lactobacillus sp. ESL0259]